MLVGRLPVGAGGNGHASHDQYGNGYLFGHFFAQAIGYGDGDSNGNPPHDCSDFYATTTDDANANVATNGAANRQTDQHSPANPDRYGHTAADVV
jgi:hypothetical protein